MAPEIFDDRVEMTLSFDCLRRVVIPYAFIVQISFAFPTEEWSAEEPKPEPATGPRLRLV